MIGVCATAPLLAAAAFSALVIDTSGANASQGWFTKEQVTRGQELYEKRCAKCHGDEKVQEFTDWPYSAQDLIGTIRSFDMPADRPGGLPPQEYVDIVAYFLANSGLPNGEEIEAGSPELANIKLSN